jgi:hypothetical protein
MKRQDYRKFGSFSIVCAILAIFLSASVWFGCESTANDTVDFNNDIRPILNAHCLACHGGVRQSGGFSMLFPEEAFDETESGQPALIPGDPEASELMKRVMHHDPEMRMPLEADPLATEEIEKIRRWIEQGAEWDDHWAYIAPKPVALPAVRNQSWPKNGIDYFILERLENEGFHPSRQAECGTLLRRLSLDLIGLPPSPEEVGAFCKDPSDSAYETHVDRLLESPHFGERWAAMWLDLARYADSKGYEKDNHRSIWRYRDWVIDAFNRDFPFDQFTIEQIAGDLLPDPDEEQVIATAFHRNTMTNDEGGTDDEEFRVAAVIDRVNTTWEVFLGTTMACVQCHSHPYDPFRHEEYFRFYAYFNNTEDADRTDEEPLLVGYSQSQLDRLETLGARIDSLHQVKNEPGVQSISYSTPAESDDSVESQIARMKEEMEAIEPVSTPVMRELPEGERRTTRLFDGGNWLAQTVEVLPGVPGVMPDLPENAPQNRLGVAQWLVSPENPLTARVMVNRFWDQIFGRGIVETIEDFGTQGAAPSHPELLDWLALRFMNDHEWSVKSLLKDIVTSATYRQSSHVTREHLDRDPQNRLLARAPRFRLSAEQIRDQALVVSGLFSPKMFGPSVMPPQPEGIWRNPYSRMKWETSEGEDRYRRGLYTYWRRTAPYPSMITFDAPSREVCVSRRVRTNTPLQALVLLNDPVYVEAAVNLAGRMKERGGTDIDEQLKEGYRIALARTPGEAELSELRSLYQAVLEEYRHSPDEAAAFLQSVENPDIKLASLAMTASVILNLDSFVMKE